MPLYMYQAAYTSAAWAGQLKKPEARPETIGKQLCEAAGGRLVGAWYSFGEYDFVLITEMPDAESAASIALAAAAGGAIKSAKTTALMSGADGVAAMQKAAALAATYKPVR